MSNTSANLFDDKRYAPRLNEYTRPIFNGKQGIEIMDEEWGGSEGIEESMEFDTGD